MTLPASLLTGVLTWDIGDLAADGAGGLTLEDLAGAAVTFVAAPAYLADATSGKLILPKPIGPVALSAGQQELALTDTDSVNPQAWTWTMLTTLPGGLVLAPVTFSFPASALTAGQARLVDLIPVAVSAGVLTTRGALGPPGGAMALVDNGNGTATFSWDVNSVQQTADVPTLSGGKLDPGTLPALAVVSVFTVSSQAAMLALAAQQGDIAVRTDEGNKYILTASDPTTLANWVLLVSGAFPSSEISDATVIGRTVLTAANAAAVNTALGLGTAATAATGDFAASTKGGAEKSAAGSATTGTVTLNCSAASVFTISPTGNITLAPSNVPASGTACTITVIVSMPSTLYTVTMPSGAVWLGSTPTFVASKKAAVTMLTVDGGTSWLCSAGVQA